MTLLTTCILLAVASGYRAPEVAQSVSSRDLVLYGRIVDDMRDGRSYYDAAHDELLAGGYPTRSIFNWRLPTLAWVASNFSSSQQLNLVVEFLALASIAFAFIWLDKTVDRLTASLVVAALAISLVNCADPEMAVFADSVAGLLILFSATAYGVGLRAIGLLAALAALFVRELAAPYVVVCIAVDWQHGRRRTLLVWALGVFAFLGYFAVHCVLLWGHLGPEDHASPGGWLQLGGLSFDLATAAFNGLLFAAPLWISAILVPLSLLGLLAWRAPNAGRVGLTVAAYMLLFMFFGKPRNFYWGALYTPLMMLGFSFLPRALADLSAAIRWHTKQASPTNPTPPSHPGRSTP